MELNKKHKIFADEFLKHQDMTKAYLAAYPNSNKEAARTNSYKLIQKDTIVNYIKSFTKKVGDKAMDKLSDKLSEEEAAKLLTFNKKRLLLSKIANSEIEVEDVVVIKNEPEVIKRKPTTLEIIKAIEADNRMTGDIAPTKTTQTDTDGKSIAVNGNNITFTIELANSI